MSETPEPTAESPRIRELVERFREIGETAMRDLPLYNPELEVEALGFQALDDQWVGVLITPWFMNLVRLPTQSAPDGYGANRPQGEVGPALRRA